MQNDLFDTHQYVKRAESVGFSVEQAEFQAEEMAALLNSTIVTRSILREELIALESRIRDIHYKTYATILGSIATLLTVLEGLLHFIWRK